MPGKNNEANEASDKDNAFRAGSHTFTRKDLSVTQWLQLTFEEAPPEPLELLFGLLLAAWGLWVMAPWWSVFSLAPTVYRLLLVVIPDEFVWGVLSASLGFFMLNCLYHDARTGRFWCSVCLTSFWGLFATSFAFSDWRSPATLWYLILTAAASWLIRRTRARLVAERILFARQQKRAAENGNGGSG